MSDASTLREFLVRLGFKVDQPALKSFTEGIGKATKAVVGLAGAIEGTATLVAAGIARFASNLEDLYFAAQRTGSSASQLMAFQRTAQNFGASAEEARGSIEGMAHALRSNPGNVGLLESLGIHLKRTKDGTYDATDALLQFGNAMRSRGYFQPGHFYMAEQYAQMFGISERTLLALRNGNFAREYARISREISRDGGFNKAARDAHRFMMQLRDLETQLQVFGAQIVDALQKKLGVNLEHLNGWIQKNGPRLAQQLVQAGTDLYQAAAMIARAVEWLVPKFERLNRDTDGWAGNLAALLVMLRFVGGFEIIGGILRLSSAFLTLGARIIGARAAAEGIAAISGSGLAGAAIPGAGLGILAGWGLDKLFPNNPLARLGGWIGDRLYDVTHRGQQAMFDLTNMGWTHAQAAGILGNLQLESGLHPGAIGDEDAQGRYRAFGLAQWHKPFWDLYKKWSHGKDIHSASFDQQLAFLNWDFRQGPDRMVGNLMRATNDPATVARIMSLRYERPAAGMAAANARAAAAVNINQQTDIHVHGRDALGTAREVTHEQRRVNADMARNFTGGVR